MGWGFKQPDLVGGIPAHDGGDGTKSFTFASILLASPYLYQFPQEVMAYHQLVHPAQPSNFH